MEGSEATEVIPGIDDMLAEQAHYRATEVFNELWERISRACDDFTPFNDRYVMGSAVNWIDYRGIREQVTKTVEARILAVLLTTLLRIADALPDDRGIEPGWNEPIVDLPFQDTDGVVLTRE